MKKAKLFILANLFLTSVNLEAFGPDDPLDVAVVGGGFSGLSTALKLKEQTENFMVFEGRDRLGGRAWTKIINGKPADCGAEFVDKDHKEMHELIKKYGLKTLKARLEDEVVFIEEDQKRSLSEMLPILKSLHKKLSTKLKTLQDTNYIEFVNDQWVSKNLFSTLDLTDTENALFNAVIRDETGRDGAELPVHALHGWVETIGEYITIAKVKKYHLNVFLKVYHEQCRLDGGTKVLVDAIAQDIGPDKIQMGNPITQVSWDLSTQLYKIRFQDNSEHFAKSVAMTIPFSVLKGSQLLDDQSLNISSEMRQFIDGMPYGTNSKIVVPVGGNLKLTYGIDLQGATAWASGTQELHVMLGGTDGANVDQNSASEWANRFLTHTEKTLLPDTLPTVINWSQDPFSKGSYRASVSGKSYSELDMKSEEHPDLIKMATALSSRGFVFAGEHLCYSQTGYMNSAVRTGYAAATLIANFLKK